LNMKIAPKCLESGIIFVTPLGCLSHEDLERAGGKAANLGELVQAGFPVPQGFAVTTTAYERFVEHNHLNQAIASMLQMTPGNGETVRAAFEAAPIPEEIKQHILTAYHELGEGPVAGEPQTSSLEQQATPVAVRSSATAEDLPGAAFAGQQDTFLNVIGDDQLLEAVRRCWASLWTDRAISYRNRQGIDQLTVKLAVVVQRMVTAEMAGVMFTANPVTGTRDEIHVDASPGLGEAVVSGLVTPDHFVLRRKPLGWRITERSAGKREVLIRAREGGGTEQFSNPAPGKQASIPDRSLYRLAGLGAAIQRHFGRPQDIEWAWADDKVYILQARPMTALPEPPPRVDITHRLLANNFIEMLPVRPYPLDLDTWMSALGSAVEPIFSLLGLDWSLLRLFEIEDGIVVHYNIEFPRPTWKTLLAPVRVIWRILRFDPRKWQSDPLIAECIARARALENKDLTGLSWAELMGLLAAAREISYLGAGEIRQRYFPRAVYAAIRLRLLLMLLGQEDKFGTLISGADNKTREMNQVLEELALKVRSNVDLERIFSTHSPEELWQTLEENSEGQRFLNELRLFLDRYGHRETIISTTLIPTWKDAPEMALGMIKGFAAKLPPPTGTPAWQNARDEILQHPRLRFIPLRTAFLSTLEMSRYILQIREDTHFYATLSMPIFRRILLEFGRRLVKAGALDTPEDVYHLRLTELKSVGGEALTAELVERLRATVERRKLARFRLQDTPLVDPRIFPAPVIEGDTLLGGMPGSPGVAEGPVCIVRDVSEFEKLRPGDVLVAPYTNPSWTPLFLRASAVVVDTGSLASHAAIVAREYGIPAVMGTINGTQKLQDGQLVRVDGNQGMVLRTSDGIPGLRSAK
jgi:pyruvate,water dikinase